MLLYGLMAPKTRSTSSPNFKIAPLPRFSTARVCVPNMNVAVLLTWGSDTPVATDQNGMVRPVKTACLIRDASAVRPA